MLRLDIFLPRVRIGSAKVLIPTLPRPKRRQAGSEMASTL
jgi:hypothetical protein